MAELRILPGNILLHHCPPDYGVAHATYKIVASRSAGLHTFLSSVGRFLGIIAPRPHTLQQDMEEFSIFDSGPLPIIPIQLWCRELSRLYLTRHIPMNRWEVSHAFIAKEEGGPQHEALFVTLTKNKSNSDTNNDVELRIERTKLVLGYKTLYPVSSHTVLPASSYTASGSAEAHDGNKFALDMVSYSNTTLMGPSEHIVEAYSFPPGKRINLPQLLVIANLVSAQKDYHIITSNCYWFAQTMIEVMHSHINSHGPHGASTDGESIVDEEITSTSGQKVEKGKWHGIPLTALPLVPPVDPNMIQGMHTTFHKQWDAFTQEIQKALDITQNSEYQNMEHKYLEAEERAATAKERAATAEARAATMETELRILRAWLQNTKVHTE
ncbi:hypothetical protein JOM56_010895 [Amanita muscaria]